MRAAMAVIFGSESPDHWIASNLQPGIPGEDGADGADGPSGPAGALGPAGGLAGNFTYVTGPVVRGAWNLNTATGTLRSSGSTADGGDFLPTVQTLIDSGGGYIIAYNTADTSEWIHLRVTSVIASQASTLTSTGSTPPVGTFVEVLHSGTGLEVSSAVKTFKSTSAATYVVHTGGVDVTYDWSNTNLRTPSRWVAQVVTLGQSSWTPSDQDGDVVCILPAGPTGLTGATGATRRDGSTGCTRGNGPAGRYRGVGEQRDAGNTRDARRRPRSHLHLRCAAGRVAHHRPWTDQAHRTVCRQHPRHSSVRDRRRRTGA